MKYKNVFLTFLLVVGLLVVASLAMAEDEVSVTPSTTSITVSPGDDSTSSRASELREHKTAILNEIKNIKNSEEEKKEALSNLKNKVQTMGRIVNGTVTATTGSTLTVKNNDKVFTVTTDANTKCVRHYYGTCKLSEIAVNDKVNVWGAFTDNTKTTLLAKEIRDASIMKVHGTFLGNVISRTDASFVIQSKERGNQTIMVSPTTKFIQRNEQPSTYADITVGQRVRVKGVWDKVNSTVSEVTEVKNYSIPVKTSLTTTKTPERMPPAATSPTIVPSVSPTVSPLETH